MSKKSVSKKNVEKKEVLTGALAKVKNGESQHDNKAIHAMFSKLHAKDSSLSIVPNTWGALQLKRNGDVLCSARRDGKMIISHPIFEGTGKNRTQVFKHPGGHYDHLSQVPFASVTFAMVEARVKDAKTTKQYHDEIYSGKRAAESGLAMKRAALEKRVGDVKKETKGKVSKKKVETIVAKRKAAKIKREPVAKALAQVAAEAA